MKKFENDILAELEVQSSFDSTENRVRPWAKEDDHNFKYLQLREYIFQKIDESGFCLDAVCQIIEVKSVIFVDWYIDYLDIDLRTLTKLEFFLNEKLFEIASEKTVSRV